MHVVERTRPAPGLADDVIGAMAPERRATVASYDREWPLTIVFTEDERTTRADVVLDVADRHYHGWGRARRNPADPVVPRIGEELAAARALSHLAHELLTVAAEDIGVFEENAVQPHA